MIGLLDSFGRTKPDPGAELDRSDPLAQGLVVAGLWPSGPGVPTFGDALGNPWTMFGSGVTAVGGEGGPALKFPGTSGNYASVASALPLPTASCTVLMICRPMNQGDTSATFQNLDGDSPSSLRLAAFVPYSGAIYWGFGGSGGSNQVSYTPPAGFFGKWHRMAFRAGRMGMSVWEDGIRKANSTTTVTRTTGLKGMTLGRFASGPTYQNTEVEQFFLYDRELSDGEIAEWTAAPYRMFHGPITRRFFLLSSAPAPATRPPAMTLLGVG